jgi:hypothetical protein
MAMTAQEWQQIELTHAWRDPGFGQDVREVESRQHTARPRKQIDPMIYPAILTILAVVGSLVMFVYAIRTVSEHPPHPDSVNMMYEQQEE